MGTVITIDCNYVAQELACAYLICEGDRAAFVENNTSHALPLLMKALKEHGYTPEQVEYAIITHVHLDHAGGSGSLMKLCPNATLLAHPKAARHVIDPSRLIASAQKVYGEEVFAKLYGEILPVPEARVRIMEDNEALQFGSRLLKFIHTRGHANHHFCVHDSKSNGIFTGDSFGIAYPVLQKHGSFLFPSTTPTEFDPAEARVTLEKITGTGATHAYLTHFGSFSEMAAGRSQLESGIEAFESILDACAVRVETGSELAKVAELEVRNYFKLKAPWLGDKDWKFLEMDIELNAAGIAFAAERLRKTRTLANTDSNR
ncbi:MAG: MBL fold metallo-hydrolase [Leptospirales bacterium]|nr:MBL fold metallo-hydrolase [Leptospirales bacterium]